MLLKKRQQKQMLNRLRKNNKGVTLVEVIAVIAVMSVVMAAVTGFMITGVKMSAQVSDGATAGMREQTAVEFINRRLWEVSNKDDKLKEAGEKVKIQVDGKEVELFPSLSIEGVVLTTGENENGKNVVVYSDKKLELCFGEIYFYPIENNTVTYVLNGEKHVVHLRIAAE